MPQHFPDSLKRLNLALIQIKHRLMFTLAFSRMLVQGTANHMLPKFSVYLIKMFNMKYDLSYIIQAVNFYMVH